MIGKVTQITKKINWPVVIISLVIIAVLIWIYFQGKKSGKFGKPTKVGLPKGVLAGADDSAPLDISGKEIRRISTALYDEMNGFNITRDSEPYEDFSQLSDTAFIAVYNDFNAQYEALGNGTLKQWLTDEYGLPSVIDSTIIPRMQKLNLQ